MRTGDSRLAGDGGGPAAPARGRLGAPRAALVLALLAALCCAPLARDGWFESHEEIRPIARALAAYHEIAGGDLYPRWLSTGYLGKGVPLFDFYPPAFSFLVAYAHALGVPLLLAAKVLLFLLFLAGSLGVYFWVRPHLGEPAGLVAGILYLFAPYHFVDLYVRGATAEFTALAALPFLFLAIDLLLERLSVRGLAALALASGTIVVSHFLGAFMIAPFAALYALARAVHARRGWAALGRVAAGAALGAALSAFYWLPALAEQDALSPERARDVVSGYYSPFLHFVHPAQWLEPGWGFGASSPDPFEDGMSFQVGLLLVGAVLASAAGVRSLGRGARGFVLVALGLGLAALGLTSAVSSPLYLWLEPLQLVQFPWRFLGPAVLFFSAAGAGVVRVLAARRAWLGPGLATAAAALAVAVSVPQRAVSWTLPVPDDHAAIQAAVAADPWSARFGNLDEYLPRRAAVETAETAPGGPAPGGLGVEVGRVWPGTAEVTFEVTSPAGVGLAVVPWHDFPGWEVTLDGRAWQLVPEPNGWIAFWVPQGSHVARVRFGTTPPRVAGWLLALGAIAMLGALALGERALSRRAPAGDPRPSREAPRAPGA